MSECHCGSGKALEDCCLPILRGERPAATAEELMRARYSAYSENELEFLFDSLHPDHREDYDSDATAKWAANAEWLGLSVVSHEINQDDSDEAIVQFIARYRENGTPRSHQEQSLFKRVDGQWYYVEGRMFAPPTVKRDGVKVGRNDPCPCGSGKKYKKCCGKSA